MNLELAELLERAMERESRIASTAAVRWELLDRILAHLRAEPWVAVSERLPEEDETVLVTDGQTVITGYYGKFYKVRKGYVVTWCGDNLGYDGDPDEFAATHWSALPTPPKES